MNITIFTGEDASGEMWANVYEGHLTHEQVSDLAQSWKGDFEAKVENDGGGYYVSYYRTREVGPDSSDDLPPTDDWEDTFEPDLRDAKAWFFVYFSETLAPPQNSPMEEILRNIHEL